jgi:hypothetical protein
MFFNKRKMIKMVSIYISNKYEEIIIAPKHEDRNKIIFEQNECKKFNIKIDSVILTTEIIHSLNLYSQKSININGYKKSDWSAYKCSKSKSIKDFDNEYIRIDVSGVNKYNLILRLDGNITNSEILISSLISTYDKKIGERIKEIYEIILSKKVK